MSSRLQREVDAIVRKAQSKHETKYHAFLKMDAKFTYIDGWMQQLLMAILFLLYSGFVIMEARANTPFPPHTPQRDIQTLLDLIHSTEFHMMFDLLTVIIALVSLFLLSKIEDVPWETRLADLPFWFIVILASMAACVYLAIVYTGAIYGVVFHVVTGLCFVILVLFIRSLDIIRVRVLREKKALDDEIKFVLDGATEEDIEELKQVKRCEVCKRESLYDLCLECEKKWQAERHRVRNQILRAKQHNLAATLTLVEWLAILDRFHWRCAYCQTGPFEVMEHYVPIVQGGGTTAENVAPSCIPCNAKKSGNHPEQPAYRPFQATTAKPRVKQTTRKSK